MNRKRSYAFDTNAGKNCGCDMGGELKGPWRERYGYYTATLFFNDSGNLELYQSGRTIVYVTAGIASGAAALIMEWLTKQPGSRNVSTSQVANIMILGTEKETLPKFPNREWGYGTLDIYQSLDRLRRL